MFSKKAIIFLEKTLGKEGIEELKKFELFKPSTNTALSPEEMRIGLQIVPRTILALLEKELKPMEAGSNKIIQIPAEEQTELHITKHANDVYSGEIFSDGKLVGKFKDRSLPGVGLHLMTSLELYSQEEVFRMGEKGFVQNSLDESKIQAIIDERLRLNDIVSKIVDKKLAEREAIEDIVKLKLTKLINSSNKNIKEEEIDKKEEKIDKKEEKKEKKPLKLKEFLDKKRKKIYGFKLNKNETVECDICGHTLFNSSGFSGCVCLGQDMNKKVNIKKSENEIEVSFPKNWDLENIETILSLVRKNQKKKI